MPRIVKVTSLAILVMATAASAWGQGTCAEMLRDGSTLLIPRVRHQHYGMV